MSHIVLSYEPKITPLFFPTQESCSGLLFLYSIDKSQKQRQNRYPQDQYTWYMAARILGKFDTTKTNIHGRSLSWLHKGTSVKGGYIELIAISYWLIFWLSYSKEKLFQKSTNKKQELPMTAMFVNGLKRNEQFPQRTFHECFLPRFGSFGQAVSEQKISRNRSTRYKNCLWWLCLLMDRDKMSNRNREPSIDATYQVSVHLTKRFQRTRCLELDQLEIRIAYGSHIC